MKRYNSTPLSRITNDYVEKSINSMLIDLLGEPGKGAGKAEPKGGAYEASMGYNTPSAYDYTSAQRDRAYTQAVESNGGSSSLDWISAGIGLLRDVLGYAHADKSAKVAYERQNEYYDNHLSMPAKVAEYEQAGLNPYGLAGAGVGATSAPSVAQGQTPSADGLVSVLSALLNYKVQSKAVDADIEFKRAQTTAQELENNYITRRREQELAISRETYRKLTADATTAEITAIWAPQMLDSEFRNREADTALKNANKTLSEEKAKEVQQSVEQAAERFPEEIKNLKQNYAQMAALTYVYTTSAKNNVQELENLKQQFANLEEQNREIKNRADLHQTEIDTFMARNSKVTEGSDGMIIVTAPDGTVTRFDPLGIKKTTRNTMDGKVAKNK